MANRWPTLAALAALAVLAALAPAAAFEQWDTVPGRGGQPVCITIPHNMTLCRGIGYSMMKLPNLLDHDSLSEISQQAASWVPLLNLRCDPDAQLFLCSLFAPICMEQHIYPCRSLCQKVEHSCGARMQQYGFPWPDMVRCDQFPADNDMCITAQSGKQPSEKVTRWQDDGGGPLVIQEPPSEACNACNQPETKENMLDHFCRSDVAVRTRFRRVRPDRILAGKARFFKPQLSAVNRTERRSLRRPVFRWTHDSACCPQLQERRTKYLVMARSEGDQLVPTFITPWKKTPVFRQVRRLLRNLDCSDQRAIRQAMLPAAASGPPPTGRPGPRRPRPGGRPRPAGGRGRPRGRARPGRVRPTGAPGDPAPSRGGAEAGNRARRATAQFSARGPAAVCVRVPQ
ncbi:secreted frizzled-related protein 5-like [Amphibalanus amphitrite]|uniref:secreted frizzled-related protein 5-like n=1 Tax=Amphibalanus amphitrite TaxID=1232801 RepID=UPI001C9277F9|nr:secreted frizzled-related protein 5-like [Amphibalanus amphitrite]